jgi:penicillin-binding protein 2
MKQFSERKYVFYAMFIIIGFIFIVKLFFLQVVSDEYKLSANNQALRHQIQYPVRGLIRDRNNLLMVYNEAAYNLMVIPKNVKNIDTVLFCQVMGIEKEFFIEKMNKVSAYSRYKESIFIEQIPADQFSTIAEVIYKFPGFFAEKRTLRKYPLSSAGHLLGYVSEVDNSIIEKDKYYKKGDYIGKSGIEKSYEDVLRGKRGKKVVTVDVLNRVQGSYKNGMYDTLPESGTDLTLTIDAILQQYGELLMQNKRGSIVAIEPATGELLALVSSPSYDPNLLVGRDRSKNYLALAKNDSLNPLFDRALMASYPPGSIYKIIQALIGLEEKSIHLNTGFNCNKKLVGCHNHPPATDISKAIQYSCNPYFYETFRKIIQPGKEKSIFIESEKGMIMWEKHMHSFGLGQRLALDLPNVKSGYIPSAEFYNKIYGKNRWAFSTIYSISIGQGEVSVIPLQMANLAAIIANRGYYITPHLIKNIGEKDSISDIFKIKNYTSISPQYFEPIVEAMQTVIEAPHGTARQARIEGIEVCGKTGTAENPHGEDHSVFIAFAPKENPKIAIAVYVENSGFGGAWAAPIASLMIEKYLTGTIQNQQKEQRILDAKFLETKAKPKKAKK